MTSHRATSSANGSAAAGGPSSSNSRPSDGRGSSGDTGSSAAGPAAGASPGDGRGGPPAVGQTHYQLLELAPGASAAELRQAFRSLSKRYHPDTTSLPAAEAREAFARLRQAYAVLADPDSRSAYDAALMRPRTPPLLVAPVPPFPAGPAAARQPIGVRRSLSGGEWFALVLLGLALALSLVLGVGLAWARGTALITRPSWWTEPLPATAPSPVAVDRQAADPPAVAVDAPALAPQPAGIRQAP